MPTIETLDRTLARFQRTNLHLVEHKPARERVSPTDIVRVAELGRRYVACPAGQAPHSALKLTDDERAALVQAPEPPPDGTVEPGRAGFTPRNIVVGDQGVTR
jgi:hypothetical protein